MGQPVYLLKQMPYAEFVDWLAYSRIEPFGDERSDWRAALQAYVVAETNRGRTKRKRPFRPKDFLLKFEAKKEQGWKSQLAFVEMLNQAFGGKDERGAVADAPGSEKGRAQGPAPTDGAGR